MWECIWQWKMNGIEIKTIGEMCGNGVINKTGVSGELE